MTRTPATTQDPIAPASQPPPPHGRSRAVIKWLKRGLWAAAWGCWLWCGFGLARELPRQLGERLCRVPVGLGDSILGFVGDTDQIAVYRCDFTNFTSSVDVYEGRSGERVFQSEPLSSPSGFGQHEFSRRSAILATVVHGVNDRQPTIKLAAIDLRHPGWKTISGGAADCAVHPTKPWVAFIEQIGTGEPPLPRLVVYDMQQNARILQRGSMAGDHYRPSVKFADDGLLVVPFLDRSFGPGRSRAQSVEIWNLSGEPRLKSTIRDLPINSPYYVDVAGPRIAFGMMGNPPNVDVFDFERDQFIFSFPPRELRSPDEVVSGKSIAVALNQSGRILFSGMDRPVLDLATGRKIWKPARHEDGFPASSLDHFMVREHWSRIWDDKSTDHRFDTDAFRWFETGSVDFRTAATDKYHPRRNNYSNTLTITGDGNVHRLPLCLNYPLLILCQTILALPLILLWAMFRWRRHRRLRLANPTP